MDGPWWTGGVYKTVVAVVRVRVRVVARVMSGEGGHKWRVQSSGWWLRVLDRVGECRALRCLSGTFLADPEMDCANHFAPPLVAPPCLTLLSCFSLLFLCYLHRHRSLQCLRSAGNLLVSAESAADFGQSVLCPVCCPLRLLQCEAR